MNASNVVMGLFLIVGFIVALFLVIVIGSFFKTWLRAKVSGAPVTFFELIGLWLQRVPIGLLVDCRIMSIKAGLEMPLQDLQAHYMAGGDVFHTVQALITADKAGFNLDFRRAAAIDLATKQSGKNVQQAVMTSVNPRVIDCPTAASGKTTIDAVAKDGIQLKAKARVTVRTNLERFVGGATEETIVARVGEGIVTTIGSADTYKLVLENPDMISKRVLEKGLDAGSAYEILSVDIADVDVGENIGAILQTKQAEADKQIAQARAEIRRATAVALEQEMKARTQEMRARVTEAEAQVPLAISEAFRTGRLGIMDYYRMDNIQADTSMRGSIAGDNKPQQSN